MSKLEEIACVLFYRSHGDNPDSIPCSWEEVPPEEQDPFREDARAVIDCLMEPSEGMLKAGCDEDIGQLTWQDERFAAQLRAALQAVKDEKA